jgi:hypothetical protein
LSLSETRLTLRRTPLSGLRGLHALHEALDLSSRVNDALLTGVEGMTNVAEVGAELLPSRPRGEGIPARANHRGFDVFGMNAGLHWFLVLLAPSVQYSEGHTGVILGAA